MSRQTGYLRKAGDWWDALVGVWSPRRQLLNQSRRARVSLLQSWENEFGALGTHYRGARLSRLNGWHRPPGTSADAANLSETPMLRDRSRDLYRNNELAASVLDTFVKKVVGTGIRLQSRPDFVALGVDQEQARELARRAERNWRRHHYPWIDYNDRESFWGLQALMFRTKLMAGEAIAIRRFVAPERRPGARYGLCWQVVEPDQLMSPPSLQNDPSVRSGVRLGTRGEPVAYYFLREHPGGPIGGSLGLKDTDFEEIPARDRQGRPNVIHDYDATRPGQTRGVPILGPIIERIENIAGYDEAEWVANRAAACYAVFLEVEDKYADTEWSANPTAPPSRAGGPPDVEEMQPGLIHRLNKGERPIPYIPNRPGNNYGTFMTFGLNGVGMGVGIPYEHFTHDWKSTTYTSGRMAELDAWETYEPMQDRLIYRFCQPTWELFVEELQLRGDLPPLRGFRDNRDAWCRAQWTPPARRWVDPVKDATARVMAKNHNLTTLSKELGELGDDWEDVLEQRALERGREAELGIVPPDTAKGAPPADGNEGDDNGRNSNR